MAGERKTGAGSMLSGVLERAPQPRTDPAVEPEAPGSPTEAAAKGRGVAAPKPRATPPARAAKRIKGRTVYLPDDLFERILVQAHRRDVTISDYVTMLLDRHVPDHRVVRTGPPSSPAEPGESDAA